MTYRFPDTSSDQPDWTIDPVGSIPPDQENTYQANLGQGTDGVEKVLMMNNAAEAQFRQNIFGFLAMVNPTGNIADIPFSVIPDTSA